MTAIVSGAARLTAAFRQLDVRGDGIAPEVLGRLLQYLDAHTWTQDKVSLLLGAVGTRQNGRIHCEDLVAWLMEGATPNELLEAGSDEEAVLVAVQFACSRGPSVLASPLHTSENWYHNPREAHSKEPPGLEEADMLIAALPSDMDDAHEEALTEPPTRRPSIEEGHFEVPPRLCSEIEGTWTLLATDDSLLQSIQRAASQGPTLLTSSLAEASAQLAEPRSEESLLAEVLYYSESEPSSSREASKAPPERRGERHAEG